MEAVPGTNGGTKPDPKGRIDGGQETVVKLGPLKAAKSELMRAHFIKEEKTIEFREMVTKVAKECGLQAKVVNRYIRNCAKETLPELEREQEQLALVFYELQS